MNSGSFDVVGAVTRLWRYPVKSMRGEQIGQALVDRRGLVGDRRFAVWDAEGRFGSCKNSRRFRRMDGLLDFRSGYGDDAAVGPCRTWWPPTARATPCPRPMPTRRCGRI